MTGRDRSKVQEVRDSMIRHRLTAAVGDEAIRTPFPQGLVKKKGGGGEGDCPPEARRPRHRPWRRGFGLSRSRASRFSSYPSAPEAGSIPVIFRRKKKVVEEKGIEPSTPTLRTWCSPS